MQKQIVHKLKIKEMIMSLAFAGMLASCNTPQADKVKLIKTTDNPNGTDDSLQKGITVNTQMAIGDRPDIEQETPTPKKEQTRIANSYDIIKRIDTTLIRGIDHFQLHVKYYSLKNDTLIIPKSFTKSPNDFVTHPYESSILLKKEKKTIFYKQINARDLTPFIKDNFGGDLKRYGSILMPTLSNRNIHDDQIVLVYSIAIPATDIGKDVFVVMSKKGDYKVIENY